MGLLKTTSGASVSSRAATSPRSIAARKAAAVAVACPARLVTPCSSIGATLLTVAWCSRALAGSRQSIRRAWEEGKVARVTRVNSALGSRCRGSGDAYDSERAQANGDDAQRDQTKRHDPNGDEAHSYDARRDQPQRNWTRRYYADCDDPDRDDAHSGIADGDQTACATGVLAAIRPACSESNVH